MDRPRRTLDRTRTRESCDSAKRYALARLDRAVEAEEQLVRAEGLVRDFIGPRTTMRNKVRAVLRDVLTANGRGDEATRLWADVSLTGT